MLILAIRVKNGKYQFQNHNSIEMTGLYWHFVDLVWIFPVSVVVFDQIIFV